MQGVPPSVTGAVDGLTVPSVAKTGPGQQGSMRRSAFIDAWMHTEECDCGRKDTLEISSRSCASSGSIDYRQMHSSHVLCMHMRMGIWIQHLVESGKNYSD